MLRVALCLRIGVCVGVSVRVWGVVFEREVGLLLILRMVLFGTASEITRYWERV